VKRPFAAVMVMPYSVVGFPLWSIVESDTGAKVCQDIADGNIAEYIAAALNAMPEIPDPPKPPRESGYYRCKERVKGRKTKGVKQPDMDRWDIWYWSGGTDGYWQPVRGNPDFLPAYKDNHFLEIDENRISEEP